MVHFQRELGQYLERALSFYLSQRTLGSLSSLAANLGAVRLQTFVLCCDPKKVYGDKDGASLIDDTNFNLNDNMVSLVMVTHSRTKMVEFFKKAKILAQPLRPERQWRTFSSLRYRWQCWLRWFCAALEATRTTPDNFHIPIIARIHL